ncbi:pentatricopeptide repeat-containing protein At1g77360, mitochondrial [Ricinus communis]|uniref:Pentatricopeptide repeat-containing protein, putative n=1 Tax=Ricinus communis TaxID=3988 RepID=B9T2J9_RICCO|nr:pentatricopeptide repeat-containing protein At1g77360, mitochondrial [Ricinus communis]EEF29924.1 pentatricopeptide repeat-containing protein, putative [Ricinus communis]|eukprot:XP_002532468.1 pentatricopeptide repeat-containing protein At1g77360, mitochondrial [Ricinus communis]
MGKYGRRKRHGHGHDHNNESSYKKPQHHSLSSSSSSAAAAATTTTAYPNKHPTFPSYLETPNLSPKIKLLCEIIAKIPSSTVETILDETGLYVSQYDVEQVIKLSYSFPGPAVKFFRWAGFRLQDNHSPYSWNLVVDLLGKNCLFDAMWDAIKSMKSKELVSLATFASVFGSYVTAGRVKDAIFTFEVMNQYGVVRDVVALNSLLSAICRDGKTVDAVDFLFVAKNSIKPDADTFAILLEGWEKELNLVNSRQTFDEMVREIGWDPANTPAYDTFLCTLLMGRIGFNEVIEFLEIMKEKRCCPGMRFFRAAIEECLKVNDVRVAGLIWEVMMETNGFRPDIEMYNLMISLYCYTNNTDIALRFLDEMVYNGVFPDRQTYNLLFQFLIKSRKLKEASVLFNEMIKNECLPNQANCSAAVRVFMHSKDPYMAIKVWKCMIENYELDLEETGNLLIVELCDLHMDPEAVKYAESMIGKGIKVTSPTMEKLKLCLKQARKEFVYERLLRKWKAG